MILRHFARSIRISPLLATAALCFLHTQPSFAQLGWGFNSFGELTLITNPKQSTNPTPHNLVGISSLTGIAAGTDHTLGVKGDGTVWAWGNNQWGQLGNTTNINIVSANTTPVQVAGLPFIKAVAAGNHSVALANDGTIWAWGNNQYGELGNSNNMATNGVTSTPTQVSGMSGVTAIAAGYFHTLALKNDGTVWAWGDNQNGQVGINDANTGTSNPNPLPVQVPGLPTIVAIAAGTSHSLALASDGTVWAWGLNRFGQLGSSTNNLTNTATPPFQIGGLSNITAISGGGSHSLLLKSDGTILAFGVNHDGQLGNDTNLSLNVANPLPTPIASFTGVTAISAGDSHSMALKSDGSVWTWGFNLNGQLGYTTLHTFPNQTPTQVTGIPTIATIAAGMADSFALPPVTVAVTIASAISGSTFSVTGTGCQAGNNYAAPQTLQWLPNSACSVEFTTPQSGTPGTQYVFTGWADGSLNNPRTITTPASATTYTGQFQTQFLLTVASNPPAGGSVIGAGYHNANDAAPISASANAGYNFSSWTGPVASSNSASTTVTMTGPLTVTANFTAAPVAITIASVASGLSFSVTGTGCQPGSYSTPQILSWAPGSSCSVSFASPQAGAAGIQYAFSAWEDTPSTNSRTITAPSSATTYTADFQTQFLLTVAASPAAGGVTTGSGYYNAGSSAPVSTTANTGYSFANWSGPVVSAASASTTVIMSGPLTVTANFNVNTMIASSPAGLSFSVTGTGCSAGSYSTPQVLSWTPGASCSVGFITPQAGPAGTQYTFSAWEDSPSANLRTIVAPASPATLTADFQTQYLLTVAASPAGSGSITGGGYYNAGSNAPVSATANSGYAFVNWTGPVASAASAGTTVTMTAPLTVTANFSVSTTITSSPSGLSFSVTGAGCQIGTFSTPQTLNGTPGSSCSVSFGATQAGGTGIQHVFSAWADGPSTNPRVFVVTNSPATYTANFQRQYLLTTSAGAGGSISSGGYFNEGTLTAVSAAANPGYQFTGFSGDLTGIGTPQNITMNGPHSVTANFGLITSITVGAASGKYSDPVTLSATLLPGSLAVTGTMQFSVGGVSAGAVPVNGSGTYTLPYVITQKQGPYAIAAVFTSSTLGVLSSSGTNTLSVSLEDAVVTPSAGNPVSVAVGGSGAASFTLTASIQEVADGSQGDITKAAPVTFTLTPVLGATPMLCSPATATVNGASLTVSCTFSNVPVNVYDVSIVIGGDYYTGSGKTSVAVYDSSLGFLTANGSTVHNGFFASLKGDAKFRNDGSLQGSFSYIEQRSGGTVTVSDAGVQSLSIVGDTAILVAPVTVNGVAGYTARAFFINNGTSGKADQFGLQVTDQTGTIVPDLTFALVVLTNGNIQVH